jgi:hypothetical protein
VQEFQKKEEHWKTLPVYSWGVNKKKADKAQQETKRPENRPQDSLPNSNINFVKGGTLNNSQFPKESKPNVTLPVKQVNSKQDKPSMNKVTDGNKSLVNKPDNYIKLPMKQIIDYWKNSQKMFLEVHDKIKYKCESLSLTKMTPIISALREGVIQSIQGNKITIFRNDIQVNKRSDEPSVGEEEESPEDMQFLHNFYEISILETCLNEERKQLIKNFLDKEKEREEENKRLQQELQEKKKKLQESLAQAVQNNEKETSNFNPDDIKKTMIGKQVNNTVSLCLNLRLTIISVIKIIQKTISSKLIVAGIPKAVIHF